MEELTKVWFEIDLKCLYLESIGRPDIPWSGHEKSRNGPERVTDALVRLISYIHNTSNFRQCCHVGNTADQRRFGIVEKLLDSGKVIANITALSYDMKGHAKKCVERHFELANKRIDQLYKVSTLCVDDHKFKKEELETVGELPKVCSQIVLKCLHLARIGRPDILWSVHMLARAVSK